MRLNYPFLLITTFFGLLLLKLIPCKSKLLNRQQQERLMQRLPNALIIGSAKCGTTALSKLLSLHPNISVATTEINYFNLEFKFKRGLKHYAAQMPVDSGSKRIRLEKSIYFTHYPPQSSNSLTVASRVHSYNSSIKLIILVREPVQRLISDVVHGTAREMLGIFGNWWPEWGREVPTFVQLFGNSSYQLQNKTKLYKFKQFVLNRSLYSIQLRKWLKYFSLDQFLIVDGDLLTSQPSLILGQVTKFLELGMQPLLDSTNIYYNKTKRFYCWKQVGLASSHECLPRNKGRRHPIVPQSVLKSLGKYFRQYNSDFFKLIGKNFPWNNKYL